ncbi:MAG: sulfatase [Candidatus Nanohaloarchaea archaeon]
MKNVVFIVTDAMRRDRVGAYNNEVDFTGSIDKFAEEATIFEDAVSNSSWTLPSHASFFTGIYPWEHYATQRNLELKVEKDTLAERFSEEGYKTYCYSINGFLRPHSGLLKGFDRWGSFKISDRFSTLVKLKAKAEKWLASDDSWLKKKLMSIGDYFYHYKQGEMRETEKIMEEARRTVTGSDNFFLFMNLMDPHVPYFPPEEYRKKHSGPEPSQICQDNSEYYSGKKEADFNEISRIYNASIDYMDDQIGEFFDFLKKQDIWDDTVIVLVSDHGQLLGEEGHYGHQYSVHEKLVQVPLIVKGAGRDVLEEQVELRELYDLIQGWAGLAEKETPGTEIAKGGYEFPDMMRQRIPEDRIEELYRRHTFARKSDHKVVRSETEKGEVERREIKLEEGDKDFSDLRDEVPEFETQGNGEKLHDKDEEVKKKLRDLGYG